MAKTKPPFDEAVLDPTRDLLLTGLENMMIQYLREMLSAFQFVNLTALQEFVDRRFGGVHAHSRAEWARQWGDAAAERMRMLAHDYHTDRERLYAFFAAAGEYQITPSKEAA
ncbi:hypothetical protein [Limnoglobus roseus]|uniref:Uncharacterized protein n=1 Tax=Limnoglobus roseus TaxID=2598579 RepID=A0A5C1AHT1_9BACT|nr:hypothetical protein [Limnoglobus roseus]QEL17556.1 hypothetical protein PX52LOC_04550 [Limnoglobus roseus]